MKKVLVVEDDLDMRAWIALHLEKAGYQVDVAANGLQAAAHCLQSKPDLILTDLHMPHTSGLDMMRILSDESGLEHIPVIFLTVDEGRRDIGRRLGAAAYLTKPVKPEVLLATIAKYIGSGTEP
jgi:CheY-like chemotaxis protein